MKVGDKVTIYNDPITKQSVEGEAYLREFVFDSGKSEFWNVSFIRRDGTLEHNCQRTILKS